MNSSFKGKRFSMKSRIYITNDFPSKFPDGLVVRIRRSHRRGRASIPRLGEFLFSSYYLVLHFTEQHSIYHWEMLLYWKHSFCLSSRQVELWFLQKDNWHWLTNKHSFPSSANWYERKLLIRLTKKRRKKGERRSHWLYAKAEGRNSFSVLIRNISGRL